jgi:hypothetical protein
MGQSHVNLPYHIVFSTKGREPLIVEVLQPRLYDYLGGIIRKQGGAPPRSTGWKTTFTSSPNCDETPNPDV